MGEGAWSASHMEEVEPVQIAFERGQGMQCASHMQEVELA